MARYSIERLVHFNCDYCDKWWSIGDFVLEMHEDIVCPWCGTRQEFHHVHEEPET